MEIKNCISFQERYKDHLGNNRMVIDSEGNVLQRTDYYPYGTPFYEPSNTNNSALQQYKYNGKELDVMHGLNTYDYGARQYYPVLPIWDRVDPFAEKYYPHSPYGYCRNNLIIRIDIDGLYDFEGISNWANGTTNGVVTNVTIDKNEGIKWDGYLPLLIFK